jgi:hypothetical protein
MFTQRNNPYCELLQKFVMQKYNIFVNITNKNSIFVKNVIKKQKSDTFMPLGMLSQRNNPY